MPGPQRSDAEAQAAPSRATDRGASRRGRRRRAIRARARGTRADPPLGPTPVRSVRRHVGARGLTVRTCPPTPASGIRSPTCTPCATPSSSSRAARGRTSGTTRAAGCSTAPRACGASTSATGATRSSTRPPRRCATLASYSAFGAFANAPALRLAERLSELAPVDDARIFFVSGGGDAIDTAAKLARRYFAAIGTPERVHLISRTQGYHGTHGLGTSIGGIPANRADMGPLDPSASQVPHDSLEALEAEVERVGADRVAAIFVEPVIGAGGVHQPRAGLRRGRRGAVRAHRRAVRGRRRHQRLRAARHVVRGRPLRRAPGPASASPRA